MTFKQKVYNQCIHLIDENINSLQNNLNELTEGLKNDSKSSAGDKHETSISMAQIEQEKIRKQLNDSLQNKSILEKIDIEITPVHIVKGSLVKANSMYLFISIALGKVIIDTKNVMILSPQSPLGIKLMGKKINETVEINGVEYFIESIQ